MDRIRETVHSLREVLQGAADANWADESALDRSANHLDMFTVYVRHDGARIFGRIAPAHKHPDI